VFAYVTEEIEKLPSFSKEFVGSSTLEELAANLSLMPLP